MNQFDRRQMLALSGACLGSGMAMLSASSDSFSNEPAVAIGAPFRYCLNTGTIMGHNLGIVAEVELAAATGYSGIELWLRKLNQYIEDGNSLSDLRQRISDLGLVVESAIGFSAWAVDDATARKKALDEIKRDMDQLAQIGGKRMAASPAGIQQIPGMDLDQIAERYRTVLDLGRQMNVLPQLEIWGSAMTLGRVSEAIYVATQSQHPDACLLLDIFHMYKGNSGFEGLKLLNGAAMHVFHVNDYPADPDREKINDSHRVYPGDGIAPLDQILRTLFHTGFRGALSLELFNRDYWQQAATAVARTGLEKMRAAVEKAIG